MKTHTLELLQQWRSCLLPSYLLTFLKAKLFTSKLLKEKSILRMSLCLIIMLKLHEHGKKQSCFYIPLQSYDGIFRKYKYNHTRSFRRFRRYILLNQELICGIQELKLVWTDRVTVLGFSVGIRNVVNPPRRVIR